MSQWETASELKSLERETGDWNPGKELETVVLSLKPLGMSCEEKPSLLQPSAVLKCFFFVLKQGLLEQLSLIEIVKDHFFSSSYV